MWYTYLAIFCLLLVIFWNPVFEHMTNSDVAKKLEFHASSPNKWHIPNAEDTKKKLMPVMTHKKANPNQQIMGPTIPEEDTNAPAPSSDSNNGTGVYPSIYGPESLLPPGHKDSVNSGNSSGTPEYTMMPTTEFPAGPAEPAPFLTDFSAILNGKT